MEQIPPGNGKKILGGRVVMDNEVTGRVRDFETEKLEKEEEKALGAYPETAQVLINWTHAIDWQVVTDLFIEYAVRSGVSLERFNAPERIYFLSELKGIMDYRALTNSVQVNVAEFDAQFRAKGGGSSKDWIRFIRTIFHEWTHGTGVVSIGLDRHVIDKVDCVSTYWRYGFEQGAAANWVMRSDGGPDSHTRSLFRLLNEGITEQISHEVLWEYVQRYPNVNRGAVADTLVEDIARDADNYDAARYLVMALADAMARYAGISTEIVWRGFVREYFSGELSLREIRDLFSDLFGNDFSERVAAADSAQELRKLASSLPHITRTDLVEKWLEHLDESHGAK